jgi:hypothetical protein
LSAVRYRATVSIPIQEIRDLPLAKLNPDTITGWFVRNNCVSFVCAPTAIGRGLFSCWFRTSVTVVLYRYRNPITNIWLVLASTNLTFFFFFFFIIINDIHLRMLQELLLLKSGVTYFVQTICNFLVGFRTAKNVTFFGKHILLRVCSICAIGNSIQQSAIVRTSDEY